MVKRDDNVIDATQGSVRNTAGNTAEPGYGREAGDTLEFHEAHYRPEMGRIVPTDPRLKSDGR